MIDIHSHIIYGVDDGPADIEQSVRMVNEAEKAGIKVIIATPHYSESLYEDKKLFENYTRLLERIADYNISIKLGCEVLLGPFSNNPAKTKTLLTLGNSRYMLIEFPFDAIPPFCSKEVFELQLAGITVILAHPERNKVFLNNFDALMEYVEKGCLLQLDSASILGVHGWQIKGLCKKLIRLNMVHFVASDAHRAEDYLKLYNQSFKKVKKWAGEKYAEKLFCQNAKHILDNNEKRLIDAI